jgi:hypothetical protein
MNLERGDGVSLTDDDVTDVLTTAAAFDRRRPDRLATVAWREALNLAGDFTRGDAVHAVKVHYSRTSEWLMPAHAAAIIRELQAARAAAIPTMPILMAGVDPDDPQWSRVYTARHQRWISAEMPPTVAITTGRTP